MAGGVAWETGSIIVPRVSLGGEVRYGLKEEGSYSMRVRARLGRVMQWEGMEGGDEGVLERWIDGLGPRSLLLTGDSIMLELFRAVVCDVVRTGQGVVVSWKVDGNVEVAGLVLRTGGVIMAHFDGRVDEKVLAMLSQSADVWIANVGLHYPVGQGRAEGEEGLIAEYVGALETLSRVAKTWESGGGKRMRVFVFQQTSAQHFFSLNGTGLYEDAVFEAPTHSCACSPIARSSFDRASLRQRAASGMFERELPYFEWTLHGHLFHLGLRQEAGREVGSLSCDCTHFCFAPSLLGKWMGWLSHHVLD